MPSSPEESNIDLNAETLAKLLDQATVDEIVRLRAMQTLTPTPTNEWKSPRKAGFLILLPSGNVARIRRTMDIAERLKNGEIPNPLAEAVHNMIQMGTPTLSLATMTPEGVAQALDLIDKTVVEAMVEPVVEYPPEGANPETWSPSVPGHISIMDLHFEDRSFIASVAQGGTTDIDRFRQQSRSAVVAVPDGETVEQPSKRASGPKRSTPKKRVGKRSPS